MSGQYAARRGNLRARIETRLPYHNIATVKESEEDKSLGQKTVWHITAEETVNFKRSKFFSAKSKMPKDMCVFMQKEMSRGYPISII